MAEKSADKMLNSTNFYPGRDNFFQVLYLLLHGIYMAVATASPPLYKGLVPPSTWHPIIIVGLSNIKRTSFSI